MVALVPDTSIEDTKGDGPASGDDAFKHHPEAKPRGLTGDEAVLSASVENGLEESESSPGDEHGQSTGLDIATA